MRTIRLSQNHKTIVDNEDFAMLKKHNWFISNGYAVRNNGGTNKKTIHLAMHRQLLNCPKDKEVDHINRNKLDNRCGNLRIVTRSQNKQNQLKMLKKTNSIYKGVYLKKPKKSKSYWLAQVVFNKKIHYIGTFQKEIDAAIARDIWVKIIVGPYAILNFN